MCRQVCVCTCAHRCVCHDACMKRGGWLSGLGSPFTLGSGNLSQVVGFEWQVFFNHWALSLTLIVHFLMALQSSWPPLGAVVFTFELYIVVKYICSIFSWAFLFLKICILFIYVSLCARLFVIFATMDVDAHRVQKRASDPLVLELKAVGSHWCGCPGLNCLRSVWCRLRKWSNSGSTRTPDCQVEGGSVVKMLGLRMENNIHLSKHIKEGSRSQSEANIRWDCASVVGRGFVQHPACLYYYYFLW